eukprot:2194629-Rhodomonas_salina.1
MPGAPLLLLLCAAACCLLPPRRLCRLSRLLSLLSHLPALLRATPGQLRSLPPRCLSRGPRRPLARSSARAAAAQRPRSKAACLKSPPGNLASCQPSNCLPQLSSPRHRQHRHQRQSAGVQPTL